MVKPQAHSGIREETSGTGLDKSRYQSDAKTTAPSTVSESDDSLTSGVNRSTLPHSLKEDGGSNTGKLDTRQGDFLARIYEMVLGWNPPK